MNINAFEHSLSTFRGNERIYRYGIFKVTEGIQFLCDNANCYWLLDILTTIQHLEKVRCEEFQVLTLTVKTPIGTIVCDDGNGNILYSQIIPFTDFPLPSIKLYVVNLVVMLPSEY